MSIQSDELPDPVMDEARERNARVSAYEDDLRVGIAQFEQARDTAEADIATADNLRTQALVLSDAIATRITTVSAFVPGATYRQADIIAIRDELVSILNRQKQITDAMANMYAYRGAVDQNAVITDNGIIWLAKRVTLT